MPTAYGMEDGKLKSFTFSGNTLDLFEELKNSIEENGKLKLKLEADEKAYMSLLRDYRKLKEEKRELEEDNIRLKKMVNSFINK